MAPGVLVDPGGLELPNVTAEPCGAGRLSVRYRAGKAARGYLESQTVLKYSIPLLAPTKPWTLVVMDPGGGGVDDRHGRMSVVRAS